VVDPVTVTVDGVPEVELWAREVVAEPELAAPWRHADRGPLDGDRRHGHTRHLSGDDLVREAVATAGLAGPTGLTGLAAGRSTRLTGGHGTGRHLSGAWNTAAATAAEPSTPEAGALAVHRSSDGHGPGGQ